MGTFFDTIGAVRTTDLVIMAVATVPVFLIYVVFSIVYFGKIDRIFHKKEDGEYYESHGLSRFCLGGIFFLFGLTLFDMIILFISAYSVNFIDHETFSADIIAILDKSLIFNGICRTVKVVPTDILINFTILCTAVYTVTEGIIASLRTLKVEAGIAIELPAVKRRRLSVMFGLWCYLSVIATVYTFLIGDESVSFNLFNVYTGCGLTLLILFLAERSPSLLQDKSLATKIVYLNNVVKDDADDTVLESKGDPALLGDKSPVEKVVEVLGKAVSGAKGEL